MEDHRIERLDDEAVIAVPAGSDTPRLLVRGAGARIFKRRGQRLGCDGQPGEAVAWLVGELDGVRAYFDGSTWVLTKQELYP